MHGSISGRMPMPVSCTQHRLRRVGGERDADTPARIGYFIALSSRLTTACSSRAASPSTTTPWQFHRQREPFRIHIVGLID